ncbi:hypothetical protein [Mesorhizobium sp. SP-1A]|uniref:hypothetical protein n=1 Tax=Mesorhizobium sp. SP-1A TaxID=3077840 RepID=UPI0028F6E73A|nr:hypothetical protein [Mesorhizobium sp. SP-1A]
MGVFDLPDMDPNHVMLHAIEHGWIAVSISPVGTSIGIRVRQDLPERFAMKSLQRVLKADGLLDVVVHTDHESGTASEVIGRLREYERDSKYFPKIDDQIADVLKDIRKLREAAAFEEHILTVPLDAKFDVTSAVKVQTSLSQLLNDGYSVVRSEYGSRVSDFDDQLKRMRDLGTKLVGIADEISAKVDPLFNEMIGYRPPSINKCDPEHHHVEQAEARLVHLISVRRDLENSATSKSTSFMTQNFKALWDFRAAAETLKASIRLVRVYIDRMEKAAENVTTLKDLHTCAGYYIGHECARMFSVGRSHYLKQFHIAVVELGRAG